MLTVTELKRLLAERGLAPRKSLGQCFLIDHNLSTKLIAASGVEQGDLVLEVGPGAGALTEELLGRSCRVVACELDGGLADLLADRLEDADNLRLIRGDCLASKHSLNPEIVTALGAEPFTLIANLPYNVACPLLLTLLLDHPNCSAMWVTVQQEVAERFSAMPGGRNVGEISVIAQALARIVHVATLAPSCFWPRPKVASSMIGLVRRAHPATRDPRRLQRLCRRLFTKRRKQIATTLRQEINRDDWPVGVDPTLRPEQLTIEQFESLAQRAEL